MIRSAQATSAAIARQATAVAEQLDSALPRQYDVFAYPETRLMEPLEAVIDFIHAHRAKTPVITDLLNDIHRGVQANKHRVENILNDGYGNHPDYGELGQVVTDLELAAVLASEITRRGSLGTKIHQLRTEGVRISRQQADAILGAEFLTAATATLALTGNLMDVENNSKLYDGAQTAVGTFTGLSAIAAMAAASQHPEVMKRSGGLFTLILGATAVAQPHLEDFMEDHIPSPDASQGGDG